MIDYSQPVIPANDLCGNGGGGKRLVLRTLTVRDVLRCYARGNELVTLDLGKGFLSGMPKELLAALSREWLDRKVRDLGVIDGRLTICPEREGDGHAAD